MIEKQAAVMLQADEYERKGNNSKLGALGREHTFAKTTVPLN